MCDFALNACKITLFGAILQESGGICGVPGRASGCFSVCVGAECKRFGGFAWQSVTWKTRVENVLKYRLGRRRGRFRGCKRGVSGREMGVPGVRKCHLRAKTVRFRGEKWVFSGCKMGVFGAKICVSDGKTNVPKMGKRRSVCARERFSGDETLFRRTERRFRQTVACRKRLFILPPSVRGGVAAWRKVRCRGSRPLPD